MSTGPASADVYSFEEYQLYYESTEKVVDRRLALNSWNYGLCLALMSGIGLLTTWALPRPEFRLLMLVGDSSLALVGAILCFLWIAQIRDFKLLNNAKFEVLNAMAPKVSFRDDPNVRSAEPFAKEWSALERHRATSELASVKIVALKASNAEFLVPRAFIALFAGVILASSLFGMNNWRDIQSAAFEIRTSDAQAQTNAVTASPGAVHDR